ncbi:unnamed protein product, partial [Adineta steineri]
LTTNFKPSVFFIKNDLDEFREQLPISPADSIENYQITPLTYLDEQNKIIKTLDNALPIEYHAWEKSIIYHSNMINLSKTEETGWIPTRDCRTLATYQKEILGEFNIYKPKYINPQQNSTVFEIPIEPHMIPIRKEKTTIHKKMNPLKNNKESRLHRTRNVLARVGLTGVLPDNQDDSHYRHHHHHHDKYKETIKIKSTNFWNLSNDFYYDLNTEQDFQSK